MWLLYFALLVVGAEQEPTAKATFEQMEQQVLKAKTLHIQLEFKASKDKENAMDLKGHMVIAPGDKVRLEVEGTVRGKANKMTIISDGMQQQMKSNDRAPQTSETKKGLSGLTTLALARLGIVPALFMAAPADGNGKEETDPAKQFVVGDFKLGKKDKIGTIEAQTVTYQISVKGINEPFSTIVWIDTKTHLPLKREIVIKDGPDTITMTETYDKLTLDGKIDDKQFTLTK